MFLLVSVRGCLFPSSIIKVILSCKALFIGPIWSINLQAAGCDPQAHPELTFGFLLRLPITGNRYLGWQGGAVGVMGLTLVFSVAKAGISSCIPVILSTFSVMKCLTFQRRMHKVA